MSKNHFISIFHAYRKFAINYTVLIFCLIGYSSPVLAQVLEEKSVLAPSHIASNKQLYLAGPLYDGANAIGYFWPQLFSSPRNNVLWADVATFGVGAGYRHLVSDLVNHQLCFAGVYGYLEWPTNPLLIFGDYLMLLGEGKDISLFAKVKEPRINWGIEIGTPYCNITWSSYHITWNSYQVLGNKASLRSMLLPYQDLYGYSLRFSFNNMLQKNIRPFFEFSKSLIAEGTGTFRLLSPTWVKSYAIGARGQLTDTVDFEIKVIHDWGKKPQGKSWELALYHLPIHFGLYYNANARSHALPKGYTQLPERFIPHYANTLPKVSSVLSEE